jgi:ferritin
MLSKKMQDALNAQINAEYYSAYLYLSMAAWCEENNLKGFGNWFRVQNQEEMVHVMKFFGYVIDRKGTVELKAIQGPPVAWKSPTEVFQASLAHEQHVSDLINKLVDLARDEHDHSTYNFLQWFVTEQVEEEANADGVLEQLKLAADAPAALFMLDRELGTRVFTPPPAAGAA